MAQERIGDGARRGQLRAAAEGYFAGLRSGEFSWIPFAQEVRLRAPLAPGGVEAPIEGRENVERIWWAPIRGAIGKIDVLEFYFNEDLSGICVAALVEIAGSGVVLRVADRFLVDEEGRIVEQENHFDPRAVTGAT